MSEQKKCKKAGARNEGKSRTKEQRTAARKAANIQHHKHVQETKQRERLCGYYERGTARAARRAFSSELTV